MYVAENPSQWIASGRNCASVRSKLVVVSHLRFNNGRPFVHHVQDFGGADDGQGQVTNSTAIFRQDDTDREDPQQEAP